MSITKRVNTVSDVLKRFSRILQATERTTEATESVEYAIALVLGKKTLSSINKNARMSHDQIDRVSNIIQKKIEVPSLPVQYLIEEWDFCGLELKMKPPVFIPRPETEELVMHVGEDIKDRLKSIEEPEDVINCLEIGCGSGAITLPIAKQFQQVKYTAIDKSFEACKLTKFNSQLNKLENLVDIYNIDVQHSEMYSDIPNKKFDIIVSNPPYIPLKDMLSLPPEIIRHEDWSALYGGWDGTTIIRDILKLSHHMLKPNGSLWLEVDSTHPRLLQERYAHAWKFFMDITIYNDFKGLPRFCHFTRT